MLADVTTPVALAPPPPPPDETGGPPSYLGLQPRQSALVGGRMHSSPFLLLLASAFNIHVSNGLDFKHHNNTELAAVLQQVPLSWQLVFKKSWNMFDLRNIGANSWRLLALCFCKPIDKQSHHNNNKNNNVIHSLKDLTLTIKCLYKKSTMQLMFLYQNNWIRVRVSLYISLSKNS